MNIPATFRIRRRMLGSAAAAALSYLSPSVRAETYPSRPIRFIVPYPPGGGTDIVARLVGQKISQSLGQPVVIDNKPGASTIIGTDFAAKAAADGYTIALISDSHAINPTLFPKLPYDSHMDFSPVCQLVFVPMMLVTHPSLAISSLSDFIALAKSKSGRITYASIGNGSPHHLAMEWLRSLAGIELLHVPYKGVAPALIDLVGGQVQAMFTGTSSAAPYIQDGRLVPLAVSSAKRQPAFPGISAVAEVLRDFDLVSWYGVVAPAATPRDIVLRLSNEIAGALKLRDVSDQMVKLGLEVAPSTPGDFGRFIRNQSVHMQKVIQRSGVKPE